MAKLRFDVAAGEPAALTTARALLSACGLVVALCVLLLAGDPRFFWHCDFQLWFSPLYEEIARSWAAGEWPILSRGSWTTGNLAGEYQCGTFSLFHNAALVLIWKLPFTLWAKAAAFAILYLCILASGTALLARRRGVAVSAAAVAGLCAACNGWIMAWAASQWIVALAGFAWVPWCWWAFECAVETRSPRVRWLLPAPFVYLTVSAGSPFAVLMLAAVTGWLAAKSVVQTRRSAALLPILAGSAAGFALSAPAWLALLEYHHFSSRSEWGLTPQWSWVVPWRAWFGLIAPSFRTIWTDFFGASQQHTCIEFAGALVPLAAILVALWKERLDVFRRNAWEFALLAVAIVLVSVPMFGSFRWSFRNLPLFHLTLALIGADCLQRVNPVRVAQVCSVLAILAGVRVGPAAESALNVGAGSVYAGLGVLIFTLWLVASQWRVFWGNQPRQHAMLAVAAMALLWATYSVVPTTEFAFVHPFTENLRSTAPLESRRLYLSFYSFDDLHAGMRAPAGWGAVLRPGNTPLAADLRFVNGYSSFTAEGAPALFETFGSIQRNTAGQLVSPGAEPMLDLLGVDGLIFSPPYFELAQKLGPEWRLAHDSSEGRVFHRDPARAAPAKTLAALEDRPGAQLARPHLTVLHERRRSIRVMLTPNQASEPRNDTADDIGFVGESAKALPVAVAFARPFYPGYVAQLNGRSYPVRAYARALPLVELPPGAQGILELRYEPAFLRYGVPVALITAAALALLGLMLRRRPV